ncbi:MAG: NAD(P)/FAD-dependent oxidoreductase [Candidatus Hydrothermarchaeales archaeon]
MKVGVVGSGLGGLLSGVSLAKKGHEVTVFEKLPYFGGRFTNINYEGFELSTGALHMIPHGNNGPLALMLRSLGVDIEIVPSKPRGTYLIGGRSYRHSEVPSFFSLSDRLRLTKILAELKLSSGGDESYLDWLKKRVKNKLLFDISDSFCGWALSTDAAGVSSRELIAIAKNIYKYGAAGVPMGGCKGVTSALMAKFEGLGGEVLLKTPVDSIEVDNGRAVGLSTKKESFDFDVVISDVGPKVTIGVCGEEDFDPSYVKSMMNVRGASGVKISIACDRPMIGHTGVLLTPEAKRVDGANEVTNADPSLAPDGMHLLMSHQKFLGGDIKAEIELGLDDLRDIFPGFDKHCRVLLVQTYRDGWPVNRVASGKHIGPVSPVEGLFYVGDAIKPEGWMETEGVAKGVEMMLNSLGG